MAGITVRNVTALNNPASFTDPFSFEIQYEAIQPLEDGQILPFIISLLCRPDLEWKVTYLSTPEDDSLDQELESVLVGPIAPGVYKFVLEVDPPDGTKIPEDDVIGNSAVVVSCLFNDHEFVRVGFYVNVEYTDEELRDNPPEKPQFEKLTRNVANSDPRITTKPLEVSFKDEVQDHEEALEEANEDEDQEEEVPKEETSDQKDPDGNKQSADCLQ